MISFSHIALILLKLGDWYLYRIVEIFIFNKIKIKFYLNTHFFFKIYPILFIEMGDFDNYPEPEGNFCKTRSNYPTTFML